MEKHTIAFVLMILGLSCKVDAGGADRPDRLWVCVSKSRISNIHYWDSSPRKSHARRRAFNNCSSNEQPDIFRSERPSTCTKPKCELESSRQKAVAQNDITGRRYTAHAFTRIGAEAQAINNCVRSASTGRDCYIR